MIFEYIYELNKKCDILKLNVDKEQNSILLLKVSENYKLMPVEVQRNLKNRLCFYLVFYPFNTKELKEYNKINENKKLSFIIRRIINNAKKNKINIQAYSNIKKSININRYFFNSNNTKNEEYSLDLNLRKLSKLADYNGRIRVSTELLTRETFNIIDQLIEKRLFIIINF